MPATDLTNEVALVTGATGGMGSATVRALAEAKCGAIAVCYGSDKEGAEKLCREVESIGGGQVKAAAFQADVGDYDAPVKDRCAAQLLSSSPGALANARPQRQRQPHASKLTLPSPQIRSLHASVTSALGAPTILFNNAGGTGGKWGIKSASEVPIEIFEQTWRLNCGSTYLLTQLCLPAMEERGWGRVIFCSSVAAFTGGVVGPHYASSKSAMHGLIHWLSQHYCKKGITVNGVAPALVGDTKMLPKDNPDIAKTIPVGRTGQPEEVANTVMWMIKTAYVTNKVVCVDGGMFPQ